MDHSKGQPIFLPDYHPAFPLLPPPETTHDDEPSVLMIHRNKTATALRITARCLLCAFASFFYLAAFSAGLVELIDRGVHTIFASEVFSDAVNVSMVPDATLPPLTGDKPKPPEADLTTDAPTSDAPLSEDTPPAVIPPVTNEILIQIDRTDMSAGSIGDCYNETHFDPDENSILGSKYHYTQKDIDMIYGEGAPLVLLIHTHATEAYSEFGVAAYPADRTFHSMNAEDTVIAVGDVFASALELAGISVIHCRDVFSLESYDKAYDYSAAAVYSYLEKYPSIQYVFDIHRDALFTAENGQLAPVSTAAGKAIAQTMIVVGTNEAGAHHPGWEDNLALALDMQSAMMERFPNSVRPYNLRTASFNQQLSPGFLLLEIGSSGNTLGEAKRGAISAALGFAEAISGTVPPVSLSEAIGILGTDQE